MNAITRVPLADVRPDPKQPRTYFKESALRQLAASLKKTGQRQPITVRARRAGAQPPFEIIDGERRWRACQLAGIATIRIDIENADLEHHADQHLLSLVSNFMREGHTHIEISDAVQYQIDAATERGQSRGQAVQALCEAVGKSEAWVYSYLNLQDLGAELKRRMHPDIADKLRLRMNEAVVLAPLPVAQQLEIYQAMLKRIPGARLELARKLAAAAKGETIERRNVDIKKTTERFIARVSSEVERMLDYKQKDFEAALAKIPAKDLKDFRSSLALLLDAVDAAGKRRE